MIVCPNCRAPLGEIKPCEICDWKPGFIDGIPVMLPQRPTDGTEVPGYAEAYEGLAAKNLVRSNIDTAYLRHQAENIVRYLGRNGVKDKDVCDIGVGQGFFAKCALDAGARSVTGVDIAESYLRNLLDDERVRPILANAEDLPFENAFDVIVATDIIEHVIHLSSALYCLNKACRMNGTIAIRVPYRENIVRYSPHMGFQYKFGHLRTFNTALLKRMMLGAGFRTRRTYLDGFGLGMPRGFWKKEPRRWNAFVRFRQFLNAILPDPTIVTTWHSSYTAFLMRPNEVVVVATKVADLPPAQRRSQA